jgi:hypothetical protein
MLPNWLGRVQSAARRHHQGAVVHVAVDSVIVPDATLDPAERARRARHLRAAYFSRLALRSAQVRRERALRRQRQNAGHAS